MQDYCDNAVIMVQRPKSSDVSEEHNGVELGCGAPSFPRKEVDRGVGSGERALRDRGLGADPKLAPSD